MDPAIKAAIKELLHLIVDKEEAVVLQALLGKLPPQYAMIAQALSAAAMPVAVAAQDKIIDAI